MKEERLESISENHDGLIIISIVAMDMLPDIGSKMQK